MNFDHDISDIRLASRASHPGDTFVNASGVTVGGVNFTFIAGPCSVESEEQIYTIAKAVKNAGASLLRGGAFTPRTSPYSFQGLREEGIRLLVEAGKKAELPVVSEITDLSQLPLFEDIDVIQVGARNMQNYELLRELGKTNKPILLKRGASCTISELLMSAEYILSGGNGKVILCERGIRTFETSTRATLDVSAIPVLKKLTHLPVIVDPSHAAGYSEYVKPLSLAACAAGCNGLMIEVHNDPAASLSDASQALTPNRFENIVDDVTKIIKALYS